VAYPTIDHQEEKANAEEMVETDRKSQGLVGEYGLHM
jgi:hypothetical protein